MKHRVTPQRFPWLDPSGYRCSLGLEAGGLGWFSAQTGSQYDPEAGTVVLTHGLAAQAQVAYAKLTAVLNAADRGWADVLRVTEYVRADVVGTYTELEEVRATTLVRNRPAVSTVVVRGLARPDALVAIEVVAGDPRRDPPVRDPAHERPAFRLSRSTAHGLTFLSSIDATDGSGGTAGSGDLAAQARVVYERAAAILGPLGMGVGDILKTATSIRSSVAADHPQVEQVRADVLAPPYGADTVVVLDELAHPDALISVDVIASPLPREAVALHGGAEPTSTSAPGCKVGKLLVLSGVDGPEGRAGGVVAQAHAAYARTLLVLEAAGVGPEALVQTVDHLTPEGLAGYRGTAQVREQLLTDPYPVATAVVCDRLRSPGALIQVDGWALLPDEHAGPKAGFGFFG